MKKTLKYVLSILLTVILSLTLIGCSEEKKAAKEIVNKFVENYRALDFDSMYAMTSDQMAYFKTLYIPDQPDNKKLFQALADNLEFKITKINVEPDTITVYAHTKNIDAAALLKKTVGSFINTLQNTENVTDDITNKAYSEALDNALSAEQTYIERDTVYNLIKDDNGNWIIDSNVGIYDDLCGGYLQYFFDTNYAGSVKQALSDMAKNAETKK